MCGISVYIPLPNYNVDVEALTSMTGLIAHRGPDDQGIFSDDRVGLGHRRLSILDLSADGHQPMKDSNNALIIVFNGEVYNYIELREELKAIGYVFTTQTDTEVVMKAYAAWGEGCSQRFNGMWSFAIYDVAMKKIFCSRDHFGIKPFYYSQTNKAFVIGSEIRQLLPFLDSNNVNEKVLTEFIFSNVTEPVEDTFFASVKKLPGAHNLVYDLNTGDFTIYQYYSLDRQGDLEHLSTDEAAALYGQSLKRSIELRLRSDVPVGTCLSGGLDSSSLATLASRDYTKKRAEKFRAITAISEDITNDESSFAKIIVEQEDLNWLKVKPDYDAFINALPEVVRAQEEPFSDCSIIMQYFVMRTAKENNIKVLLDGQGGDETLLGYERYYSTYLIALYKNKGLIYMLKAAWSSARNNTKMRPLNLVNYFIYFMSARLRYFNYKKRNNFLRKIPKFPAGVRFHDNNNYDIFEMQKRELIEYNLPALLKFEDKNSMWHSIEARLPFLDPNTARLGLSLPEEVKIHKGWTKFVLRLFMDDKMTDSITWRKNKIGFEGPDDIWIQRHKQIMLNAVTASSLLNTLCKMENISSDFKNLENKTAWKLYSIALWEKEFNVVF
jgi:asparagine synthase (glutamine-hydrolysing)